MSDEHQGNQRDASEDDDGFTLALYGAAGALGEQVRIALEGEGLPIEAFYAAGALRSAGGEVSFRNTSVAVRTAAEVDAMEPDVAILAVPDDVSEGRRERLMRKGTLVIDVSPSGRRNSALPLIWPALNYDVLKSHEGGFAVPGAVTTTVAPVAAALASVGRLDALDVVAMLGASHAGVTGPADLSAQTLALMNFRVPESGTLGGELAFNVMVGSRHAEDASDLYEDELRAELYRLSPRFDGVECHLTALRIPVFAGTTVTLTARFADDVELDPDRVRGAFTARGDLEQGGPDVTLRDALDSDTILLGPARIDPARKVVRVTAFADATHRVATSIAALLDRMHGDDDLW